VKGLIGEDGAAIVDVVSSCGGFALDVRRRDRTRLSPAVRRCEVQPRLTKLLGV
jgi:hypothetical protein